MVGSKLTECLYLGADIYQQECGPHQDRGGDRHFLYRRRNGSFQDDDDDIVEDDPSAFYSQYSGNRSKITADTDDIMNENESRNSSNPQRRRGDSRSRSRSASPTSDYELGSKAPKTPSTPFRSNRRSDSKDKDTTPTRRTAARTETTPTRAYHRRHDSFDVAPHGIRYDQGELPRLHPVRGKSAWEESLPDATTEFEQLRNYRLSLFEKNGQINLPQTRAEQAGNSVQLDSFSQSAVTTLTRQLEPPVISPPSSAVPLQLEAPSAQPNCPSYPPWRRAPRELTSQTLSKEDEDMRRELEETKKSLERARQDLQHAQELASRQQSDTTTWASQLTNEKLMVEAKLQDESRAKKELLEKIEKMQEETAQLKSTLQLAQQDAVHRSTNSKPPRSSSRDLASLHNNSPPSSANSRGKSLERFKSPGRALADDMHEEGSPYSSRDEEDPKESGSAKRPYDSGAVLNLVREVVRGKSVSKTPPSKSPTSVMEERGDKTPELVEGSDQRDALSTLGNTKGGNEGSEPDAPYLSSRLISLRSELLDVRSQLAEADAARIKAENRRADVEAINKEIQSETRKLREEVRELKELVLGFKTKESETERKYQLRVEMVQKELTETKESAKQKEKAKEKLEEELTETLNEADELRGQVNCFMKELERTQKESEQKILISDLEAKRLQDELRLMKEKLSQTNSEIVQQASEHLRKRQEIEAELEQTKETATALQRRVLFMDDQLSQVESETEHLRSKLASNDPQRPHASNTSPQRLSTSWRKSFVGMADTISRSLSEGIGDGPIIIPEAPQKDARSSVIDRLRNSLDHKSAGDGKKS